MLECQRYTWNECASFPWPCCHLPSYKGRKFNFSISIFLKVYGQKCGQFKLFRKVNALEKDKLAQATEILSLKKRVEKLEKKEKVKTLSSQN
ncbi:hypothetical protein Tco_1116207 [Tanacetum coccineum]